MDIGKLRNLVKEGRYKITAHALKRLDQRRITVAELKEVIENGQIIESYPGDRPYPSCLVMGKVRGDFPLYVVCALSSEVHIVTAHWMDPAKWLEPHSRREKRHHG